MAINYTWDVSTVDATPQEWAENAVHNRCRIAIDEIYAEEVARMTAHPYNSIPKP